MIDLATENWHMTCSLGGMCMERINRKSGAINAASGFRSASRYHVGGYADGLGKRIFAQGNGREILLRKATGPIHG